MSTRDISDGQHAWLIGEMESWTGLGLLTSDQSKRILDLYASSEQRTERRGDRAISAIMGLAALLVGLAVFLLVAFNWQALPTAVKIPVIFLVLGGTYWGGWFLRYRVDSRSASDVVFFLGCLFYGAAIWLIAQIFNINVASSAGFWWWALGVLPFALAVGSLPLHALVVAILAYYTGASAFGPYWGTDFGRGFWGYIAASAPSVPVLAIAGVAWAYRRNSVKGLGLYVMLLAFWTVVQPVAWRFDDAPAYWIGSVGALLLLISECHRPRSRMALPYRFFGVILVGGVLVALSHYDFNRRALDQMMTTPLAIEMASAVILAVLLVIAAADLDRRRSGRPISLKTSVLEAKGRWFPLALLVFLAMIGFWNALVGAPLAPTIAANAAMVVLSLWLMTIGLNEDRSLPFTAGVLYFLIWAISRYIDLFGDFGGMPGAALMFFLCGALLFGMGQFWKGRKRVQHV